MEQLSLYLKIPQLNLGVGAIAFVTTTIHIMLTFPLFSNIIVRNKYPAAKLLVVLFLSGFTTYVLWLAYVWPLHNLFMITALSLLVLSHLIFLIQTLVQTRSNGHKKYD